MKECPQCHQFFPLTEEYFYKSKSRKSGFHPWCKQCVKESNKNYQRNMSDVQRRMMYDKKAEWRKNKLLNDREFRGKTNEYKKQQYLRFKEKCKNDTELREKRNERNRGYTKKWVEKLKTENPKKYEEYKRKWREKAEKQREQNPNYARDYYQKNKARLQEKSRNYQQEQRNKIKIDNNFSELEIALLKELYPRRKSDIPALLKFHSKESIERKANEMVI